jgi:hypothetical protein
MIRNRRIRPRRILPAVVVAWIVLGIAPAWAEVRTWTWSSGETFEAECLGIDSVVSFRKPNGETFALSIYDLTLADQKFLAAHRTEMDGGPATDQLRVRPKVGWLKFNDEWKIRVKVEAFSHAAAAATTVSNVRVDHCVTDLSTPLARLAFNQVRSERHQHLTRFGCRFQPPTGLAFELIFEPSEMPIDTIKSLRGSFVMTTGDLVEATVPGFTAQRDAVLKSEPLSQAGLQVVLNPSGRQPGPVYDDETMKRLEIVRVLVKGNGHRVHTVEMLDSQSHPYYTASFGVNGPYAGDHNESTWYSSLYKPFPPDLQLRLVVLKNIREVVVPFELANLKVPERPTE